jgi:hypothetical protein
MSCPWPIAAAVVWASVAWASVAWASVVSALGGRYVGAGRWAGGWRRPGYGLAAGAVVGGALAAGSYYGGYGYNDSYGSGYNNTGYGYDSGYNNGNSGYSSYGYDQNNYANYCAQRFRSYDPSTGTYLGYDRIRHSCP